MMCETFKKKSSLERKRSVYVSIVIVSRNDRVPFAMNDITLHNACQSNVEKKIDVDPDSSLPIL